MIIGLTGPYCSGKDTIAEYISREYGYIHYSLSDVIREMMRGLSIELIREFYSIWNWIKREKWKWDSCKKNFRKNCFGRQILYNFYKASR